MAVLCVLLAATTIKPNYLAYVDYRQSAEQFERFSAALDVAATISAERGPANSLMGAADAERPEYAAALAAARTRSDASLHSLEMLLSPDFAVAPESRQSYRAVAAQLQAGRRAVDEVAETPAKERSGKQVAAAIEVMFEAADRANDLRDMVGQTTTILAPDMAAEVLLSTTAGTLRERAGRLGSYVVMMLTSSKEDWPGYQIKFEAELARIRGLMKLLGTYSEANFQTRQIKDAVAAVDTTYFAGSLPYAREITARLALGHAPTAAEFTANYVPGMKSTEALRKVILASVTEKIESAQEDALRVMVMSTTLLALVIGVLIGLGRVLQRALFRPLLAAKQQILQIANGDLSASSSAEFVGRELREMFQHLDFLREQQRKMRQLESERKQMTEELRRLSQTDALTGLFNRRALDAEAQRALSGTGRRRKGTGVIMFDIDHFKSINDRYGHTVGDRVLQGTASILGGCLRSGDVFARYGGEEFLVLLESASEAETIALAERLRLTLEQTVVIEEHELTVTASFGVTWCAGKDAPAWEDLTHEADRCLYQAKRDGRNIVRGAGGLAAKIRSPQQDRKASARPGASAAA